MDELATLRETNMRLILALDHINYLASASPASDRLRLGAIASKAREALAGCGPWLPDWLAKKMPESSAA